MTNRQGHPRAMKRNHPSWKGRFVLGPKAGRGAQRVVVRAQWVTRRGRGMRSMVAVTAYELRYMEKGNRGHDPYACYDAKGHEVEQRGFAERTRHDPYQWRFVLSPERGGEVDLSALTRRAMAQMEQDTGYQLDWVAANHYDTGHPHSHILVRGLDHEGREVGLKRDYVIRGFQYRVQDLLTQELGPRQEQTLEQGQEQGWAHERRLEGSPQDYTREQVQEVKRNLDYVWDRPLIANRLSGIYHTPDQHNYGDVHPKHQERFVTERAAQDAGYRRAENDHYGPGTGIARDLPDGGLRGAQDQDQSQAAGVGTPAVARGLGIVRVPPTAPIGSGLQPRLDQEQDRER